MTLSSELIAISSVAVAGGTAYPVVSSRVTTRFEGPEGQDTSSFRVERWELDCHAFAAQAGDVAALHETLRGHLAGRGREVVLTQWQGSRTLPAPGVNGSQAGYPRVEVSDVTEQTFGGIVTFRLTAETRVPLADAQGLVEHDYERTEATDEQGRVEISQRGTYRVAPGSDARAAAQSAVVGPAESDAQANNRTFRVRWTLRPDASVATYDYSASDKDYGGDAGVDEARLTDRTSVNNAGRVVRVVSGYAVGTGAQAWIDSQTPQPGANEILVRRETGPASIPEGRIEFAFELLTGVTDPQFPGIVVYGLREAIDEQEQVARMLASVYLDADPVLRYGAKEPSVYVQRTRIEFVGAWADAISAVTGLFDAANLITVPRRSLESGPHGIKVLTFVAEYMYAEPPATKPVPRELPEVA